MMHGFRLPNPAVLFLLLVMGLICSCTQGPDTRFQQCRRDQNELRQENRKLELKIIELQQTTADQSGQIESLQSLGPGRLDKLVTVDRVQLGRLTGGFSSSDQVGHDGIVIYLQPADRYGHVIKAAGTALVELLDLANSPGKHLLGQWQLDADQLGKLWAGRLWTNHYTIRCVFPTLPDHDEITVRVEFTELLTGRTFAAQKLCTIKRLGAQIDSAGR